MSPRATQSASNVRVAARRTGTPRLERLCGAGALMDREIVRDHDIARPKSRSEMGLDIGVERRAVHGAIHHPGGGEPVTPERSDEGLGAPAAERRRGAQALSATAPPDSIFKA